MDWEKYGYILASKYRTLVCIELLETQRTPTQIHKSTKVAKSHISRALSELQEKGIVECLNPSAIKGRVYSLSEEGIIITKAIRKNI